MKSYILLLQTILLILSCNSQEAVNRINADPSNQDSVDNKTATPERRTIKDLPLDTTSRPFYVVCADERWGWCSEKIDSYNQARDSLQNHRASTGHRDNIISNTCPF